jgi:putative DNA primase/helicase
MKNLHQQLRAWAQKSQGTRHMGAIAKHAAPYLVVDTSQLDQYPLMLNVRNGTLVIAKTSDGSPYITLKPHDPDDRITKVCDVDYDPNATCPTYDNALALVQPDPTVRAFLHRLVGYAATGDVSEQKLFFFHGGGRNGKSTFVDIWARILGDYAATIPIERFLQAGAKGNGGQPTPDLAGLHGVRFLRTSEPERGSVLAEALIKLVTSGEPMLVRHLNRPFFELRPQFKLIISGNYKPRIAGTDDGIWRRMVLIPWEVKITDELCDPHLGQKLAAEASGILNRILDGAVDWLDNGLKIPAQIAEATADYRSASDHLGRFLADCTRDAPGARVPSHRLHGVFEAWAKANGAPVWKQTGLGRAMTDRGYHNTKSGTHFWLDIELTKSEGDFGSDPDNQRSDGARSPIPPPDDDDVEI